MPNRRRATSSSASIFDGRDVGLGNHKREKRMSSVAMTVACGSYDRTLPIRDGRIPIEGCDINFIPMEPEEVFFRSLRYEEFDVSELSFSSYLMLTSRGECPYVAVPAFISRVFRHAAIYIRTDRGIKRPEDLKG